MELNKITVALDAAIPHMGLAAGTQLSFNDGLPTIDDGLAFFTSQLSAVESKIYETKYRNIVYQDFIPIDMSDPEWVDEVTYFSYDAVGVAKFIGANADDLPDVAATAKKTTIPVHYAGNSFSYSLDELRKSQQLRMPLDTIKGNMAYRASEEHAQRVAFGGDSERGLFGLWNHPNVQSDNSTVDWATASGQEIVADMNDLLITVWENSAQVHVPDTLVLPANQWAIISNRRMDSGTDTTILEFFRKNNLFTQLTGGQLDIRQNLELQTAGVGGVNRMMAYEKTAENLGMKMPMAWRTLAPQMNNLKVKIPCEYKIGGVFFRYPGCAAYRDYI